MRKTDLGILGLLVLGGVAVFGLGGATGADSSPAVSTASVTPAAPERPKEMTILDFKVDGAGLANAKTKVSVKGFYTGTDDGGYLVQLRGGIPMSGYYGDLPKIGVLDADAPRDTRLALIKCRSEQFHHGCMITVVGQATACSWTNAFGTSHTDTCIEVKDTFVW